MSSNQINNSGTMFRQAKIVDSIGSDCPRLNNNNNNLVVRSRRRFFEWGPCKVTVIPRVPVPRIRRIKKSKHKSRLPGFFHSQLRMMKDWIAYLPLVPVIHQFGQSMAYFVWDEEVNHFDMWVLKYDHINEFTWEKKMCVTPSIHVEEEVLGVRNNGDPILAKSNNLISYSLESHQANGFVDSWDRWTPNSPYNGGNGPPYVIRPFVESLVLLND
ncbi:uncharacterized protein LOC108213134 [Daucus carota subsp. sativus]|uniref:uncharacterized protein LOC108213134 n=1 Tax=Daucus carota subsp. sativus TaxID=79200 RepID=UPI0007EF8F9D|nr:PREDICTED: uncharacterized protein LOC108213134 [Daucus carota subsp. sativus]